MVLFAQWLWYKRNRKSVTPHNHRICCFVSSRSLWNGLERKKTCLKPHSLHSYVSRCSHTFLSPLMMKFVHPPPPSPLHFLPSVRQLLPRVSSIKQKNSNETSPHFCTCRMIQYFISVELVFLYLQMRNIHFLRSQPYNMQVSHVWISVALYQLDV